MVSFPPCKINLGLNVIRKRPDGYHDIETCFYPVSWTDILEVIKSDVFQFNSSGISIPGSSEENLCAKAFQLLKHDFRLGNVKIHLHKIIPMGAGLGGGSSDAAHMLLVLNEVFELNLTQQELQKYAAHLGSDCSFFVQDKPMMGSGRGEILKPVDVQLNGKFVLIIKPDIHVSTADAYAGIKPLLPEIPLDVAIRRPVGEWRNSLVNHFEKTVFEKYPPIKKLKEQLYDSGALYASMSGSGSSVFGIFNSPVDLKHKFPSMTYWSGILTF